MLYMVRYSELGLKSRPVRERLIALLRTNILDLLEAAGMAGRVTRDGGHLYLETDEPADRILSRTFGVHSHSLVATTKGTADDVCALAVEISGGWTGTFAVRARRTGKHPFTSMELAAVVGRSIVEAHGLPVDLTAPEHELHVEVRGERAYLYGEKVPGPGGFPLGSQKSLAAVVDGPRGLAAAWLMMKRGCKLVAFEPEAGLAAPLGGWDTHLKVREGGMEEALALLERGKVKGIVLGIAMAEADTLADLPSALPVYTPLIAMGSDEVDVVVERALDPPVPVT
ncbi:MAG: THUMP domain-containing protein [Thermoplasmata archaeon]|nr:THUMP domain-containing protein [Thermoplasmata archaeon]